MRPALLLCCLFLSATAQAEDCSPQTSVGSWCELPLAALHPTQQNVGLLQVELSPPPRHAWTRATHATNSARTRRAHACESSSLSSALSAMEARNDSRRQGLGRPPNMAINWANAGAGRACSRNACASPGSALPRRCAAPNCGRATQVERAAPRMARNVAEGVVPPLVPSRG